MPVELRGALVVVTGEADLDDAAALDEWFVAGDAGTADLGGVTHLHGACLQVLLEHRVPVTALPADPVLRQLLSGLADTARDRAAGG